MNRKKKLGLLMIILGFLNSIGTTIGFLYFKEKDISSELALELVGYGTTLVAISFLLFLFGFGYFFFLGKDIRKRRA